MMDSNSSAGSVAWRYRYRGSANVTLTEAFAREQGTHVEPLYPPEAIAALTAERDRWRKSAEDAMRALAEEDDEARAAEAKLTAAEARIEEMVAAEREAIAEYVDRNVYSAREYADKIRAREYLSRTAQEESA